MDYLFLVFNKGLEDLLLFLMITYVEIGV